MRKREIGALIFGFAGNSVFFFLGYIIMVIPVWITWIGFIISTSMLVYGGILFFFPTREKKAQEITKSELCHRIGADIQRFSDRFKPIRNKPVDEKYNQYLVAKEFYDRIKDELLPHANLMLLDTPIPNKLNIIEKRLDSYPAEIENLSNDYEQARDKLKWLDGEIDAVVFSIYNDCIED